MHYLISIIFLFSVSSVFSQSIENVYFRAEGKTIVVTYDFFHSKADTAINVELFFKDPQGGVATPKTIRGDIKSVKPGKSKQIVWDILSDGVSSLSGKYKAEVSIQKNPAPNNNINNQNNNTTPTGAVDSSSNFVLDENVALGVFGDGEYVLIGEPLENDGKTKNIPNGSGYYLVLKKTLNGYKVVIDIDNNVALTIKDGNLIGNTWENLFSLYNKVSLNSPNDLLFDEDYIFQSLLKNKVPCFEIDKEKEHTVIFDPKSGSVNTFILYLKSKCDEKITSVRLPLDNFDNVSALVNGKKANTIWDGNHLKFEKSNNPKLIIKVN
jgi:hypothetical protein